MKITFVHIVEQIQYEPQIALLSAVAQFMGHEVSRVPTDFGTRQEALTSALSAEAPDLLAVRVTGELREAVQWSLAELRKSCPDLGILLFGPLAEDAPEEMALVADNVLVLSDEAEQALVSLLSLTEWPQSLAEFNPPAGVGVVNGGTLLWGDPLPQGDAAMAPPPDFGLFGAPTFFGHAIGCSYFGDVGSVLIEASIGSPSGMSANAGLRIFNYPTNKIARVRPVESILGFVDSLPPEIQCVEFADREFGWMPDTEALIRGMAERQSARDFTVRLLPNTYRPELIEGLAQAGIKRVVFEMDVCESDLQNKLEGAQDPRLLKSALEQAAKLQMSTGLLCSVGLPFETPDLVAQKIAFIEAAGIDRLRLIPFEPRYGHPWREICAEHEMLPVGDGAWNRETYTPLHQSAMDIESWHRSWQMCLDLQARFAFSS